MQAGRLRAGPRARSQIPNLPTNPELTKCQTNQCTDYCKSSPTHGGNTATSVLFILFHFLSRCHLQQFGLVSRLSGCAGFGLPARGLGLDPNPSLMTKNIKRTSKPRCPSKIRPKIPALPDINNESLWIPFDCPEKDFFSDEKELAKMTQVSAKVQSLKILKKTITCFFPAGNVSLKTNLAVFDFFCNCGFCGISHVSLCCK